MPLDPANALEFGALGLLALVIAGVGTFIWRTSLWVMSYMERREESAEAERMRLIGVINEQLARLEEFDRHLERVAGQLETVGLQHQEILAVLRSLNGK